MRRAPRGAMAELATGARAFLGGASFLTRTPGLWTWALVPAAVALGVGVVLAGLGIWGVLRVSTLLMGGGGEWEGFGRVLFDVVGGATAIGTAALAAIAVAQPIARLSLGKMTARLDESLGPRALVVRSPSSNLVRAVGVALTALGVTVPTVGVLELLTLVAPEAAVVTEPLAFAIAALGLAWELFDHPFSRRGLGVRERLRWMKGRFFTVLGFALAAQLALLIPGVGLFLLPIGVLGATRLVAEAEAEAEVEAEPRLPA